MSRFFATASDSETESESSEEEFQQKAPIVSKGYAFSDDEEETKRVVRSAKDKRYESLQNVIKNLRNHKKIKDMANVLSDFEELCKTYDKAKKVVEKEGIPRFFIRTLADLEDFVSECWEDREGRKAMSKNNSKGLTTLRQKIRKYNRDFEEKIAAYKAKPDVGDEDEQEDEPQNSEDESDDDEMGAEMFKKTVPAVADPSKFLKAGADDDDEDSDDSMDWGSDSGSMSSSSDDDKYEGNLAAKFLKKPGDREKEKDEKEKTREKKKKKVRSTRIEREESDDEEDGGDWQVVKEGVPMSKEKPKMFREKEEITHEAVIKKLLEITSTRGKKTTDRNMSLEMLVELRKIAKEKELGKAIDVKISFSIVAAIFDYNPNIATCMKDEMWKRCLEAVREILDTLRENQDIVCSEMVAEGSENFEEKKEAVGAAAAADAENVDKSEKPKEQPFRIRGCILTVIERLDEEFIKMLQACDAHSTEYVDRLKDERTVCKLIEDCQAYLEGRTTTEEICRIYLKRIEHVYYKFEHNTKKISEITNEPMGEESRLVMDRLCKYIYAKDNTDRIRTRAILCHIYHHALHDRWFEARDLMLMSHLQDTITHSDIPTQIMYNRGMVQLGLCAFRVGMVKDAHNCLVDIQSGGRAKELLAQGLLLQRQHERTPEQEKIEKRRQMPYHMHINLELLECVYLVSAMLLEIPYMAAHEFDARRRMISKNFHHVLRVSDRQPLVGPPESMREHIVAASKAMKNGDWKACKNFVINEKMNTKVWELFHDADTVRNMIIQKIQEESLRTYLFTYSSVYDSLSLQTLSEMFEIDKSVVHSTISKMIINEELMASLDEPTQSVVLHRTEPTRLQALALQLSEKVSSLVENNERIMEVKQGGFFSFNKPGQGGYQQRDNQQGGQYGGKKWYNRGEGGDRGGRGGRRGGGGWNQGDRDGNRGGYRGGGGWNQGDRNNRDNNRGGYRGGGGWNRGDRDNRDSNRGGYRGRDDRQNY